MRTEDLKFQLDDSVFIVPISAKGTIVGIFIDHSGVEFSVRHFLDGEVKRIYCKTDELEKK